jgi:uncharacterized 2Fe-2S/4Fe-4S cluster protein (DUF4445 family)
MPDFIRLQLLPLGRQLTVERGAPLRDALFAQGVEFPCGGRGRCKGCRVKVLTGALPPSAEDQALLSVAEIAAGWRLACRANANADLTLELAQWEATILADDTRFEFTPRPGLGIAVDLGTTTLVAQLVHLRTGHVLAVRSALNAQARHGADIMSRIDFAVNHGGEAELTRIIREQIGGMVHELFEAWTGAGAAQMDSDKPSKEDAGTSLERIVIVGNTAMHHLFCGIGVEPLSFHPFEALDGGLKTFTASELGWNFSDGPPGHLVSEAEVVFLPCMGGFVGSDILAGVLATKLHEAVKPAALVDLGTNGEIVLGNRDRLLCASTAAGPAFEGARISMGMRAVTGAISEITLQEGRLVCKVLGGGAPRGLCGSGLVDAVACGLDLGWIAPNGRMALAGFPLATPVTLQPCDVRELQLAKGAIAAGIRILARQWGTTLDGLERIYLAGAFGNYINRASARRIGLLDFHPDRIVPAGNTALLGAKLALFGGAEHDPHHAGILRRATHVTLNEDPGFQDIYVAEMGFPARSGAAEAVDSAV